MIPNYILDNEVSRPADAPASLRNEEIQKTVVTNPYWGKMIASDINGDGDDDADDGDDDEHGTQDVRRSDL